MHYNGPLGDYGAELRRQRRIEALVVQQRLSPATQFQLRQNALIQRSKPRYQQQYNLPKCHDLKRVGPRFLGPRIS